VISCGFIAVQHSLDRAAGQRNRHASVKWGEAAGIARFFEYGTRMESVWNAYGRFRPAAGGGAAVHGRANPAMVRHGMQPRRRPDWQ
jgi:hypothetical protein